MMKFGIGVLALGLCAAVLAVAKDGSRMRVVAAAEGDQVFGGAATPVADSSSCAGQKSKAEENSSGDPLYNGCGKLLCASVQNFTFGGTGASKKESKWCGLTAACGSYDASVAKCK